MDGNGLVKQTLDQILQAPSNDCGETASSEYGKQGQITGVGIAHRGDTEYLKSIPNGNENDNWGNLPSVSPEFHA